MAAAKADQVAETSPVQDADSAQIGTAAPTVPQSAGAPAYQEPVQAETAQNSGSIAADAALGPQQLSAGHISSIEDIDALQSSDQVAATSQAEDEAAHQVKPEADTQPDVSSSDRPLLPADLALNDSAQQPTHDISILGSPITHAGSSLSESAQQPEDGSSRGAARLAEAARSTRQPLAVVQESYLPRQSSNASVKQDAAARPSSEGVIIMVLLSLASYVTNATILSEVALVGKALRLERLSIKSILSTPLSCCLFCFGLRLQTMQCRPYRCIKHIRHLAQNEKLRTKMSTANVKNKHGLCDSALISIDCSAEHPCTSTSLKV